jgi:hypothetical protein
MLASWGASGVNQLLILEKDVTLNAAEVPWIGLRQQKTESRRIVLVYKRPSILIKNGIEVLFRALRQAVLPGVVVADRFENIAARAFEKNGKKTVRPGADGDPGSQIIILFIITELGKPAQTLSHHFRNLQETKIFLSSIRIPMDDLFDVKEALNPADGSEDPGGLFRANGWRGIGNRPVPGHPIGGYLSNRVGNFSPLGNTDVQLKSSKEWIRSQPVDVKALDLNQDGYVYQDPMDWNVIADEEGKCPLCGMFLKKVTIDEAIQNLKDNGYKVK